MLFFLSKPGLDAMLNLCLMIDSMAWYYSLCFTPQFCFDINKEALIIMYYNVLSLLHCKKNLLVPECYPFVFGKESKCVQSN
jgi:hypothetical protein